ncbi:LytR/AlgR family response regulator transcription factor [Lactobacillus corticis]|uniref:Two-component system response regulator n=1 Tax=Lactobacillus corticis TaxID=2201249 RepID=A0A916QKL4_9LACO|nr:LytTR family DNA-binding domain-containing protein [Lactobacillus corticis]GFZ27096.1 two-component system response regulator [Lactobacillus corticis]
MKVAIAEDNQQELDQLIHCFKQYESDHQENIEIFHFDTGIKLLEHFNQGFDIVYLDVQMPGISGMDTAEQIRKQDSEILIVFVTNYVQYAIDGYRVNASDFLLKPVSYFSFSEHFKKIEQQLKRREDSVMVNTSDGMVKIQLDDLYYVESQAHKITFHLENPNHSTIEITDSMKNMEELLLPYDFYRCNNSFIVNLKYVMGVSGNTVKVGNYKLPISRPRKKGFMSALTDYLGMGLI